MATLDSFPHAQPKEIEVNQIKRKFTPNGLNQIQILNQLESNPALEIDEAWDPCATCLGKLPLYKDEAAAHMDGDFGC
jgi:hypothetical protein